MRILHLFLLALGGCGAPIVVNLVPTTEAPHALVPRAPDDIRVVSTPPSEPFAEIGLIDGVPNEPVSGPVTPQAVLTEMREAAGRWGCDYLLISSSTISKHARDSEGYGGVGYHGACLVLLDASKSAALVTAPPVPLKLDDSGGGSHVATSSNNFSGFSQLTTDAAEPASGRTMLFRTAEGKVYRVKPESREAALRAGWVPIGSE